MSLGRTTTVMLTPDVIANRPAAGVRNRLFYATDTEILYWDTGSEWIISAAVDISAFSDKTYTHTQASASDTWVITHNLNKKPSISIIDSAGDVIDGDVLYNDENSLTLTFSAATSGEAYLN